MIWSTASVYLIWGSEVLWSTGTVWMDNKVSQNAADWAFVSVLKQFNTSHKPGVVVEGHAASRQCHRRCFLTIWNCHQHRRLSATAVISPILRNYRRKLTPWPAHDQRPGELSRGLTSLPTSVILIWPCTPSYADQNEALHEEISAIGEKGDPQIEKETPALTKWQIAQREK